MLPKICCQTWAALETRCPRGGASLPTRTAPLARRHDAQPTPRRGPASLCRSKLLPCPGINEDRLNLRPPRWASLGRGSERSSLHHCHTKSGSLHTDDDSSSPRAELAPGNAISALLSAPTYRSTVLLTPTGARSPSPVNKPREIRAATTTGSKLKQPPSYREPAPNAICFSVT